MTVLQLAGLTTIIMSIWYGRLQYRATGNAGRATALALGFYLTAVVVFVGVVGLLVIAFGATDERKLTYSLTAYGVMVLVLVTLCLRARKLARVN